MNVLRKDLLQGIRLLLIHIEIFPYLIVPFVGHLLVLEVLIIGLQTPELLQQLLPLFVTTQFLESEVLLI